MCFRNFYAVGGRSHAVAAQVLTAAAERALIVVAGEPVSIRVGEMAGTGAEVQAAPQVEVGDGIAAEVYGSAVAQSGTAVVAAAAARGGTVVVAVAAAAVRGGTVAAAAAAAGTVAFAAAGLGAAAGAEQDAYQVGWGEPAAGWAGCQAVAAGAAAGRGGCRGGRTARDGLLVERVLRPVELAAPVGSGVG